MDVVLVNKADCPAEGERPQECTRRNSEPPYWFPRPPSGYVDQFAVWARAWWSAHPDEDDIDHSLNQALVEFVELVEKATYANAVPALHDWSVADAQAALDERKEEAKQADKVVTGHVYNSSTGTLKRDYARLQEAREYLQPAEEILVAARRAEKYASARRAEEDAIAAARARTSAHLGIVPLQAQADDAAPEV